MRAIPDSGSDLIKTYVWGDTVAGLDMPSEMPQLRVRYDGKQLVDVADYSTFFIDANGCKHIVQHDPLWQEIMCGFDDELINDGTWQVMSEAQRVQKQADENAEQKIAARQATLARTAAIESLITDRELPEEFVDPKVSRVSL